MSGGHKLSPLEGLAKTGIVAMLFGLMLFLPAIHTPAGDINPESMVTLGFIILAAYTAGEVLGTVSLPHITAYLLIGMICGPEAPHVLHVPEAFNVLNADVIKDLKLFDNLAVSLIALSAGGALALPSLRKNAKLLGSVLTTQYIALLGIIGGLVFLLSGVIPGFTLPFLEGQSTKVVAGAAILLAIIGAAQSPAASIAIINETRSKGPMTDAVLGVSVLNNVVVVVLFGVGSALAFGMLGADAGGKVSLPVELGIQMGASLLMGGLVAGLLAAWIRFVGAELLLILVGLCFVTVWGAGALGDELIGKPIDPLLAFLFAGFLVRNFFSEKAHEELSSTVSTLSMPVYVVFFFLAGANLHLHALQEMAAFAGVLFAGRMVALYLGTTSGALIADGPTPLKRSGFLGFGAQAGIALAMSGAVASGAGEIGESIGTIAVAGIALNEMFGPVLLKASLGWAGELPKEDEEMVAEPPITRAEDATAELDQRMPEFLPEPGRSAFDPWGEPPDVSWRRLLELSRELKSDLQGLVRDLRQNSTAPRRRDAQAWLGGLRREFLRMHRRMAVKAVDPELDAQAFRVQVRQHLGALAREWEDQILDRAASADFRAERRHMEQMLLEVDGIVDQLPAAMELPREPELLTAREGDGVGLRAALLVSRIGNSPRVIQPRAMARYTLGGQVPDHLAELAGLMALSERHLLARARNIFEALRHSLDQAVSLEGLQPGDFESVLQKVRDEMEEEFELARREVDRLGDETVRVAQAALGRPYKEFNALLLIAGTPRLSDRDFRYSKVFAAREAAVKEVGEGLVSSRELTRGVANGLAMELQLLRLRLSVREAVDTHGKALGRDLRGRVILQLDRITTGMDASLEKLGSLLLEQDMPASTLANEISGVCEPLIHLIEDALGVCETMRSGLKTEAAIEPLREGLAQGVDALTDRFRVVERAPGLTGRRLPKMPPMRDVPFRELASQYLDAEVGRDLSLVLEELLSQVEEAVRAVEETQRGLQFNLELSASELGVLGDQPCSNEVRRVVEETLISTAARMGNRLHGIQEGLSGLDVQGERRVAEVVLGHIDAFHDLLVGGRWDEVRRRLALGQLERRRQFLTGGASNLGDLTRHFGENVERAIGTRNYVRLRRRLGLPDARTDGVLGPEHFAPLTARVELPVVFSRLFTDPALEAADLLAGQDQEVASLRSLLLGSGPGVRRGVAVLGHGDGRGAAVNALLRGLSERLRIKRHTLTQPVSSVEEVQRILDSAKGQGCVVIEGVHWLYRAEPGGFEPLRHLVSGILEDEGENAWVLSADPHAWAFACSVVPLTDLFPGTLELQALDAAGLREVLMNRHAMSGYRLRISRSDGNLGQLLRDNIRGRRGAEERYEETYFERLHEATGGVLRDALHLWMASVTEVDPVADSIVIGDVPESPFHALRELSETDLISLRQLSRQGRLDAANHADSLHMDPQNSAGELARLQHWGILRRTRHGFVVQDHLLGPLRRVLVEKGLDQ